MQSYSQRPVSRHYQIQFAPLSQTPGPNKLQGLADVCGHFDNKRMVLFTAMTPYLWLLLAFLIHYVQYQSECEQRRDHERRTR